MTPYIYKPSALGAEAPTVVLLPGMNMGGWYFENAFPHFKDYNVISWHNPGVCGIGLNGTVSVAQIAMQVRQTLQELDSKEVYLLGHSMGGFTAQEFAYLRPKRLKKLILVSTSLGQPDTAQDLVMFTRQVGMDWNSYYDKVENEPAKALKPLFGQKFLLEQPEAYAAFLADRDTFYPGRTVALQHTAWGGLFSSAGRSHMLHIPTLVVHGQADALVSVRSGRNLANAITGAELKLLDDVGHNPSLEDANFWTYVKDFIES